MTTSKSPKRVSFADLERDEFLLVGNQENLVTVPATVAEPSCPIALLNRVFLLLFRGLENRDLKTDILDLRTIEG